MAEGGSAAFCRSSVSAVEKAKAIRLQADPIYKLDEENNQPETHTDTKLSSLSG